MLYTRLFADAYLVGVYGHLHNPYNAQFWLNQLVLSVLSCAIPGGDRATRRTKGCIPYLAEAWRA